MAFSLEDYRDLKLFRQGGMCTVYLATHKRLSRPTIIKALSIDKKENPVRLIRFENEARSMALLDHENIVRIYDYGKERGSFYIAMEFVYGRSLQEILSLGGAPVPVLMAIMLQALKGLRHSHSEKVIHRDVKPSNILVSKTGTAKLADFGLAYARFSERLPQAGAVTGTPHYMAPELLRSGNDRDPRVDIWAAGVILYKCIAGRFPFNGASLESLLYNITKSPPPDPLAVEQEGVSDSLRTLVLKCLQKDPENRPASVDPLIGALSDSLAAAGARDPGAMIERYIKGCAPHEMDVTSVRPAPISSAEQHTPAVLFSRTSSRRFAGALGVVAILLVSGIILFWKDTTLSRPSPAPRLAPMSPAAAAAPIAKAKADAAKPREIRNRTDTRDAGPVSTAAIADAVPGANVYASAPTRSSTESDAVRQPLPAAQGTGEIDIRTFPRAEIIIDGKSRGMVPLRKPLVLTAGTHSLVLSHPGYADYQATIHIKKDGITRIKARLERPE
jgi:serine/threonine-protein kinase